MRRGRSRALGGGGRDGRGVGAVAQGRESGGARGDVARRSRHDPGRAFVRGGDPGRARHSWPLRAAGRRAAGQMQQWRRARRRGRRRAEDMGGARFRCRRLGLRTLPARVHARFRFRRRRGRGGRCRGRPAICRARRALRTLRGRGPRHALALRVAQGGAHPFAAESGGVAFGEPERGSGEGVLRRSFGELPGGGPSWSCRRPRRRRLPPPLARPRLPVALVERASSPFSELRIEN